MWVRNGRAAAPPWISWSTGVSISRKPFSSSVRAHRADDRRPGCGPCRGPPAARSCRRSAAGPAPPRRGPCAAPAAGAAPWRPSATARPSPTARRVARRSPGRARTRGRRGRPTRFHASSASSPTSARLSITWSRVPIPSWRVAKQSLPVLRTNITRPATPTTSWVSSPVSRWPHCSRTSARVWVRATTTGYGGCPSSSSRARFSRRTASWERRSSGRVLRIHGRRVATGPRPKHIASAAP